MYYKYPIRNRTFAWVILSYAIYACNNLDTAEFAVQIKQQKWTTLISIINSYVV